MNTFTCFIKAVIGGYYKPLGARTVQLLFLSRSGKTKVGREEAEGVLSLIGDVAPAARKRHKMESQLASQRSQKSGGRRGSSFRLH